MFFINKIISNKKVITLLMTFLLCSSLFNTVQAKKTEQIQALLYFALEGKSLQPESTSKTHFECSDKIYAVLEIEKLPKGKHQFSLRWNDPSGEELERVDYPFTATQQKTRLWAWLNLIRSRGAGMIQWINPAAGLEEFIGPWTADIYIDGKKIASESFSVDC